MAIVFPASPSVNETFTAGSITYKWDGDKWIGLGVTPADRLVEGSNSLEINASNQLVWSGGDVNLASNLLYVDETNNAIGVNTNLPVNGDLFGSPAFTISGTEPRLNLQQDQDLDADGTISSLLFTARDPRTTSAQNGREMAMIRARWVGSSNNNLDTDLSFYTANGATAASSNEKLRIAANGNIGIGSNLRSGYPIDLQTNTSTLTLNLKLDKNSTTGDYAEIAFQLWDGAGTGANTFGGTGTSRPGVVLRALNANGNTAATDFIVGNFSGGGDNTTLVEQMRIASDGGIFLRNLLGNASSGSAVKYSNSDDELRYDTSSRLLKTNITECTYGIETVKKLKPSRYTPQEYDGEGNIIVTDEVLIGFIAEEMVEEVPEVVQMYPKYTLTKNKEDTEIVPAAISYDKLTAVLTKALQEAIAEIETLKGRLDAAGL